MSDIDEEENFERPKYANLGLLGLLLSINKEKINISDFLNDYNLTEKDIKKALEDLKKWGLIKIEEGNIIFLDEEKARKIHKEVMSQRFD